MTEDLKYPTGKWVKVPDLDAAGRAERMDLIAAVPAAVSAAVAGLTDAQLDTPYRDGAWSPRKIVHHLADAHMNAFIRVKLGLLENNPTIKPYNDGDWAETTDSTEAPVQMSLSIIEGLHARWAQLLRSLGPADFERTVQHPDRGPMSVGDLMQLYAWHGRHHTTQITQLRQRRGW
ncbi:MAG: YfiT family bacillithiol transferase [Vicinamibacterales bacterium]